MSTQVAFLRAINVGGRQVKMTQLVKLFESIGLDAVTTYIASGNVRYRTRRTPAIVEPRIEAVLRDALGFEVETFVRTPKELVAVIRAAPFTQKEIAAAHAQMFCFLKESPSRGVATAIAALSCASDRFAVVGRELHWLRIVRESDPKVHRDVARTLGAPMTGRNLNTVHKMAEGA